MNQANLWSSVCCWKKKKFSLQVNCLSGARDIRSNFMSRIINYDLWNFNSCLFQSSYRSWDQSRSEALMLTQLSGRMKSLGVFRISVYVCSLCPDVLKASQRYKHKCIQLSLNLTSPSLMIIPQVFYRAVWLRVLLFFLNYNLEKALCSWKINQCELTYIYPRSVI